jgi:hypothetical protein
VLDEERFPPFSTREIRDFNFFFFDKGHVSFVAVRYVARRIGVAGWKTIVHSSLAARAQFCRLSPRLADGTYFHE